MSSHVEYLYTRHFVRGAWRTRSNDTALELMMMVMEKSGYLVTGGAKVEGKRDGGGYIINY